MASHDVPLLGSDRAEDLTGHQVLNLFTGASGDEQLVSKLMSPGTHLLQGCRGSGKTMLLRVAYERLQRERTDVLPVFVSFSRYLATYNTSARPTPGFSPFQSWVLAKMLASLRDEAQKRLAVRLPQDVFGPVPLDAFAQHLETHYADPSVANPSLSAAKLGVSERELRSFARLDTVRQRILRILDACKLGAVDFLLDEAAQSFAEDLQPLFFSLIRHMRHNSIWIKASTYPHTTNYGQDFDVGHDAIILQIERQVELDEGMRFFEELIERRFAGTVLGQALGKSELQVRLMIKASGGVPRWFIHILNALGHTTAQQLDSNRVVAAIKEFPDSTLWPFLQKVRSGLRAQKKYVDTAKELVLLFIEHLREYNQRRRPSPYVAISNHKTVPFRVHAGLGMLQYAGLISSRGLRKLSKERDNGVLYIIHPAILIKENVLYPGSSTPAIADLVSALSSPSKDAFKEYTKNSPHLQQLHEYEEEQISCCSNCSAELSEQAKFCAQCGAPVAQESPYIELLKRSVEELELTPGLKRRLIEDGRFKTIGDVVAATDEELDQIEYVGKPRLRIIRYATEEFLCG